MLHWSQQHIFIATERVGLESDGEAKITEFIRTRGITRCPTACVSPTQGLVAAADRAALEEYAVERERMRRARLAARERAFLTVAAPMPGAEEKALLPEEIES
jgi:hypothetical protein